METRYMPDESFVAFVKSLPNERKELVTIDGKNRWKIKDEDGTEYILRPDSSKK